MNRSTGDIPSSLSALTACDQVAELYRRERTAHCAWVKALDVLLEKQTEWEAARRALAEETHRRLK